MANAATAAQKGKGVALAVVYITCLFFIWALVTNLLDPLLKTMKTVFTLSPVEANLTGFAFFIAYGLMSLPSAAFLSKFGYARSVMVGLGGIVAGCFIAIAAAQLHTYSLVLTALFVMASGITLLQVAANPLIASLGKPEDSSFRLNLSQAFNSLGAACGLWFGANFLLKGEIFEKDIVVTQAMREQALGFVSNVYLAIGVGLALFILMIFMVRQRITDAAPKTGKLVSPLSALKSKWANLGALGIFVYVGAEVAISLNLLLFLEQTNILNISAEQAGKLTTFYMVFAMIGRFAGSALLKAIKDYVLLSMVAVGAIALCLVVIFTKDMIPTAHTGVLNLFLAQAPLTSGLIPAFAALLIGLLCMAIVGGAVLPLIFASIEEATGSRALAFVAPLVCYVYVLWFALAAKKAPVHEITEEVVGGH